MFKFVLCALLAAAVAEPEPGALIAPYATPFGYSSTYLAPATTTYTKTAAGYVANPYFYSSSPYYPHFIKKRSAPLLPSTYVAPAAYTYTAGAPLLASSYSYAAGAPIVSSAPVFTSPFGYSHFIKKRSAPLLPYSTGYIAPAATSYSYSASAPLLTSTYAAAPIVSASPYYSSPFAYSTFIKK